MIMHIICLKLTQSNFAFLQTNPFDLFETFFGSSNPIPDMDTRFETRRRSTVTKGEDIR